MNLYWDSPLARQLQMALDQEATELMNDLLKDEPEEPYADLGLTLQAACEMALARADRMEAERDSARAACREQSDVIALLLKS